MDLRSQDQVRAFFESERPEFIFLAAAKVGGIHANSAFPADFLYENLIVEANVIHESWKNGVKKLLMDGLTGEFTRILESMEVVVDFP